MARIRPLLAAASLSLAACAALTGCTGALKSFGSTSEAFDGAWVGQMNVVSRTRTCIMTRGGIRLTIDGGYMQGNVRQSGGNRRIEGLVQEDGTLSSTTIDAEFDKDTASLTGRFEEMEAEGHWTSEECDGTWSLRKIR
ncbi:hypothetical protein KAJ83_07310 [Marivibrio halodurans]|uniref:Uncharacterized protein n=1 Tax=Marivibrio halodurans TaxID=2039722 RepID=A0A8J7V255_9PROT|nr:hypothetical protein [Marivibrio halodurans]MBP5856811.1 hypothetical protein [Marivibrio halodurans]